MAEQPVDQAQPNIHDEHIIEGPVYEDKLSAGDPAIDIVFGGGLPHGSLSIVMGPPGAGKTILAQQISFANAKAGKHVIYFTNVSEPHAKLIEHMHGFDFFDADLIGTQIQIYNITSQIRDKDFKEVIEFVIRTVRSENADLVVIDSFRGLKHVLEVSVRDRSAIFDLAAQLSILGCTSILVGEYTATELQTEPEFAIADGIINLWHRIEVVQERRTLCISKMRGGHYLGGEHSFEINSRGIQVYPRQEALTRAPSYRATQERVSMGIPALDKMMFGGPIRSSSTLLAGSAGVGKTVLSLHFLAAGAAQGERGLMISFQENPEQLLLRASHFGLADQLDLAGEQVEILHLSPVELDLDFAAAQIRAAVERQVRRVVIDSVAELEVAVHDPERFDDFVASLGGFLRSHDVTTLMTREITPFFGGEFTITSHGLSYIVDNIVLLRYIELQAQIRRTIAVLKSRGSDHDKSLREFRMINGQVLIDEPFQGLSGLLTGMPQIVEEVPNNVDPAAGEER